MMISLRAVATSGFSDEKHLKFCAQYGYPILTRNARDFRQIHEAWQSQSRQHAGIFGSLRQKRCQQKYDQP